jgi:hypothetical protein
MTAAGNNIIRVSLGLLLLIIALNALAGGYYGMAGAENVPREWLKRGPFRTYFIPSLFLFAYIGIYFFFTSIAVFRRKTYSRVAALISGIILLLWIILQVAMIGYVSWLQPAMGGSACLILTLSFLLPKA